MFHDNKLLIKWGRPNGHWTHVVTSGANKVDHQSASHGIITAVFTEYRQGRVDVLQSRDKSKRNKCGKNSWEILRV